MAELDARRAEVLGNAARKIQRSIRTYIARKEFVALREFAIQLQALCRCMLLCSWENSSANSLPVFHLKKYFLF